MDQKDREPARKSPLGKLFSFLGTLVMVLAILLCLTLAVPRIFGLQAYIVISGSMEPAIPVGSAVYARACDPREIEEDQVIVFYNGTGDTVPVTHRVLENHPEDGELITKGDANEQEDIRPARYENVIGRVVLHVPLLGYLVAPLASMQGKISLAMVILAGFLLTEIGSFLGKSTSRYSN